MTSIMQVRSLHALMRVAAIILAAGPSAYAGFAPLAVGRSPILSTPGYQPPAGVVIVQHEQLMIPSSLADLFQVESSTSEVLTPLRGQLTISGAYEPSGEPAAPGDGRIQSVPLPSSFFTGLGLMLGCLIIAAVRKKLGT